MTSSVRLGPRQREFLLTLLNKHLEAAKGPDRKTAQDIADKLEKSELVKKRPVQSLGWYPAFQAMSRAGRVFLPPSPSDQWKGWMSATIAKYGLTEEHCRSLVEYARAKQWREPFSFELLIKNAPRYLAELAAPEPIAPAKAKGPVKMEDL